MQTVTVDINHENGFHLLQELEKLNVLRIAKEGAAGQKNKHSDKFKGVFSKDDAESFNQHMQNMRKEWAVGTKSV